MPASLALLLVTCLVTPPEARGAEDRPAVQVPRSRATVPEPAPAPESEPEPAPATEPTTAPEPALAPEPAPELPPPSVESSTLVTGSVKPLPSWREAPPVVSPEGRPVKPKLPSDGGPGIVLGSLAIGGGLAMIAGSIALAIDPGPPPRSENAGIAAMGVLALAGGSGLLTAGVLTRKKFRRTELGSAHDAPPTGRGMHVAGAVLMSGGAVTTLMGTLLISLSGYECFEDCRGPLPSSWATLGIGLGALVSGSALFIASQVRGTRYRRWLQPSPLGLSGRF